MVWAITIGAIVVIAFAVFEWRAWKKPMPGRLQDTTTGGPMHGIDGQWWGVSEPFHKPPEFDKPRDR